MLMFFLILYVIILSIVRWTKYIKLKKKWKVSGEILNNRANNKKTWYITTVILVLITIISLLYEKIQRSKIPDVDESIFYRSEHQIKLPDEKDALIQSQNTFGYWHTNWYTNNIWKVLDALYSYEERNSNINRENHSNECIILNSWWISYCLTWKWNENTLNRFFNYYTAYTEYDDNEEYFVINNEKVTILEYLDAIEPDMRAELLKLDKTLSMDYYIPNDQYLDVLPPYFQSISRASTVALQYYTLKKDWKMVIFIVQLNYKMVDIANHVWGTIYNLISIVIQIIIDDAVNSSITMFPENVRTKLIKQYHEELWDKDNIIHETAKWEYVLWKSAQKDVSILGLEDFNEPSLFHFITHFPFYWKDDTKKLILYSYNMMYNGQYDDYYDFSNKVFINKWFIYNFYGKLIYWGLMPRLTSLESRIDRNIAHKEALITNLQSGDYDMRFGKSDLEADPSSYRKL